MRSDLPREWTVERLGDHVDLLVGFPFKSAQFTDDPGGVRLLRGDNVGQGRLRWDGARRWPTDMSPEFERYEVCPDDIVLAMDRPWIEAGLKYGAVREEDVPCLLVQRVARLRGSITLSQRYLRYMVGSPGFTSYVRAVQTGTAVPHISGQQIADFRSFLPPRLEQERIASILGSLDDKIDSNRRLRLLLKQIGAAQFSLLRSGVDCERDAPLGDLAATIKRGITPRYRDDGGLLVLNQRCIRDNTTAFGHARRHDDQARAVPDDRMLRIGDVLVNSTGVGTLGRVATIRWLGEPATVDSHVAIVRPNADLIDPEFLAWELISRQAEIEALAEGTTGQTELSRARLSALRVSVPSHASQQEFAALAGPLRKQSSALEQEDLTLAHVRDALLPKLISGKIRVPDTHDPEEVIGPADERFAAATS